MQPTNKLEHDFTHWTGCECNHLWLLKNSFRK
jgi:hypothetical protein